MFTDSSGLILGIPILVGMFVLMARFDLYLAKRRNQVALSRYMAEMDSHHNPGFRV
jgi:hypothetical protein